MPTVTRKDLERQVMALQALAMECAKARTISVFVDYFGHVDAIMIRAHTDWKPGSEADFELPVVQLNLSDAFMSLAQTLDVLKHAHRSLLRMHMQALDTLDSEHTEVEA